jgi:hypothetical protein
VQIRRRCLILMRLAQVINTHFAHLFFGHAVDAHSLGWAMSATSSRAFGFGPDDKRLLPLIDMMNHSFTPSAKVALQRAAPAGIRHGPDGGAEDALVVTATRDLRAGDELTINYGFLSNDHFLLLYGFVPSSGRTHLAPHTATDREDLISPHDTCLLPFDPNALDLAADLAGIPFPFGELERAPAWKQDTLLRHRYGGILSVPETFDSDNATVVAQKKTRQDQAVKVNKAITYTIRPVQGEQSGVDPKLMACLRVLYADADIAPSLSSGDSSAMTPPHTGAPALLQSTGIGLGATTAPVDPAPSTSGSNSGVRLSLWEVENCAGTVVEQRARKAAHSWLALTVQAFPAAVDDDRVALGKARTEAASLVLRFRMAKKLLLTENVSWLQTRL